MWAWSDHLTITKLRLVRLEQSILIREFCKLPQVFFFTFMSKLSFWSFGIELSQFKRSDSDWLASRCDVVWPRTTPGIFTGNELPGSSHLFSFSTHSAFSPSSVMTKYPNFAKCQPLLTYRSRSLCKLMSPVSIVFRKFGLVASNFTNEPSLVQNWRAVWSWQVKTQSFWMVREIVLLALWFEPVNLQDFSLQDKMSTNVFR